MSRSLADMGFNETNTFFNIYNPGGEAGSWDELQAVMAGRVPPNAQGELQGAITSIMSLSAIVGPFVMNNLFFYFTHDKAPVYLPGAPFFLGSILMATSFGIAYRALHPSKLQRFS